MAIGHSSVSASSQLLSISVLKIAPGNILFVGDAKAGAVFAFELGPAPAASESRAYRLRGIDGKIADLLGVAPGEVVIRDLAVHPVSKEAYVPASSRCPRARPTWPSSVDTLGRRSR